jgi:putative transposase
MMFYSRTLPHWQPPGKPIFITWRLNGSLPKAVLDQMRATPGDSAGKQFRRVDVQLDSSVHGPLWLKDPRIARCVADAIRRGENQLHQYVLNAFVVMANHVHMLVQPSTALAGITRRIKGATARQANRILGRAGKPFWQNESFDHWVRDSAEFERIRIYIEWNPVKAGLVENPEDWHWSNAWGGL